jgi:hypothetical protein
MRDLKEDDVILILRALPDPDGVPVGRRIARGLKYLLRSCYVRCVRFEVVLAPPTAVVHMEPAPGPRAKPEGESTDGS